MPLAWLPVEPERPPRLMTLPPLHSLARPIPPKPLVPTTCPASLMLVASLNVVPGRLPRSVTVPPLHSVAQKLPANEHSACAEPAVSASRQVATQMAYPNAFQCDMSPSPICKGAIALSLVPVTTRFRELPLARPHPHRGRAGHLRRSDARRP